MKYWPFRWKPFKDKSRKIEIQQITTDEFSIDAIVKETEKLQIPESDIIEVFKGALLDSKQPVKVRTGFEIIHIDDIIRMKDFALAGCIDRGTFAVTISTSSGTYEQSISKTAGHCIIDFAKKCYMVKSQTNFSEAFNNTLKNKKSQQLGRDTEEMKSLLHAVGQNKKQEFDEKLDTYIQSKIKLLDLYKKPKSYDEYFDE